MPGTSRPECFWLNGGTVAQTAVRNTPVRKMNCCRWASVLGLTIITFGISASAAQTPTAQPCGVDQDQQAQRFFADPEGKNEWKEYSPHVAPQLHIGGAAFVRLWAGSDSNMLFRTEQPGEDFAAYTDYCFDRTDQLIQLRFELRTVWGWGYRIEGPILKGSLASQMAEFFSTKTGMRITRPAQAGDIADALKPKMYLRKSQLPFFKLLAK